MLSTLIDSNNPEALDAAKLLGSINDCKLLFLTSLWNPRLNPVRRLLEESENCHYQI